MAIYKGDETPYAKIQKEKTPDVSAATLITSDAVLNKSVEDYISYAVRAQTLLDVVHKVATAYYVDDDVRVRLIEKITGE